MTGYRLSSAWIEIEAPDGDVRYFQIHDIYGGPVTVRIVQRSDVDRVVASASVDPAGRVVEVP